MSEEGDSKFLNRAVMLELLFILHILKKNHLHELHYTQNRFKYITRGLSVSYYVFFQTQFRIVSISGTKYQLELGAATNRYNVRQYSVKIRTLRSCWESGTSTRLLEWLGLIDGESNAWHVDFLFPLACSRYRSCLAKVAVRQGARVKLVIETKQNFSKQFDGTMEQSPSVSVCIRCLTV